MEYKTNYERYKATGFLDIGQYEKAGMYEVLDDDLLETHEKLAGLRKFAGLNQQQYAEILGVTQSAVSQWEKGTKKPTAEILIALADLYGIDLKEFLIAFGFTFRN